jgi:prepilin-type N-terminal cleavage/methylation domain-containing protein
VRRGQRGVTLVELLAALVVSALVVVLATRIFLSGNRQFRDRSDQSDRLSTLFRLKSSMQSVLRAEITRCASGGLWLRDDSAQGGGKEIGALLKARFPGIESMDVRCFETSPPPLELVEWQKRFQPNLVEYRIYIRQSGKRDSLSGSWIK